MYTVPGYFAADGNAAQSSATAGNKWRVHVTPDKTGRWSYRIAFVAGKGVAVSQAGSDGRSIAPLHGRTGMFQIAATDKRAPDFRGRGRLQYAGRHYLQFAGSGEYFLKLGADSPETLLAYTDFDGTIARKPQVPLRTFAPHVWDWRAGDPTWKDGKGKGLVGALDYLASKGVNSISFLPYNAGGDGDNVWPFVSRDDKFHYDVSKLDQWQIVFDYAQQKGIYLHFKLQENEIDDNRRGNPVERAARRTAARGGAVEEAPRALPCRESRSGKWTRPTSWSATASTTTAGTALRNRTTPTSSTCRTEERRRSISRTPRASTPWNGSIPAAVVRSEEGQFRG